MNLREGLCTLMSVSLSCTRLSQSPVSCLHLALTPVAHARVYQEKKGGGDQKEEDKMAAKREAEIKKMEDLLKMVRQVEAKQDK